MPTQENVDRVWRILPDPPVLFGLACWQEEDRYGLRYDVWVCLFLSSFVIYQTALLVTSFSGTYCQCYSYMTSIVLFTYGCITNYSNGKIYHFSFCKSGIWVWLGWALWLSISHKAAAMLFAWTAVILKLIHMVVGRIQFTMDC